PQISRQRHVAEPVKLIRTTANHARPTRRSRITLSTKAKTIHSPMLTHERRRHHRKKNRPHAAEPTRATSPLERPRAISPIQTTSENHEYPTCPRSHRHADLLLEPVPLARRSAVTPRRRRLSKQRSHPRSLPPIAAVEWT